jgi:hypothetical protein
MARYRSGGTEGIPGPALSRQTLTARQECRICQVDIFSRLVVTIHPRIIAPGQDGVVVRRPRPRRLSAAVSLNSADAGPSVSGYKPRVRRRVRSQGFPRAIDGVTRCRDEAGIGR